MRLFSYCIPVDDGAAPNPFWGICTLAICKPVIRRVAKVGDWVVGVGSKKVNRIDYSGKLVYAMRISDVMTMEDYDKHCRTKLIKKIPQIKSKDYKRCVGDCIYDFEKDISGKLRLSVHGIKNKPTDIGGRNVLLSNHFYYFGDNAIVIPAQFKNIIKQGQGHKSNCNDGVKEEFVEWIEGEGHPINQLQGKPQYKISFKNVGVKINQCAVIRCDSAMRDENMIHSK